MYVPSTEGRPREASQGWGGTGTRGCGSQLHPRADPGTTPPATKGWPWSGHRGTRKREKPVARWTGAFLLLASALARHTPSLFGGTGKETGKPQARPNLGAMKLGCLTTEYDYSPTTPAAFTIGASRSSSLARNVANSAGVSFFTSTACLSSTAAISGDFRLLFTTALSRATTPAGMPAGPTMPVNDTETKPGKPLSIMVGTSGACTLRVSPVTAIGRTRPACAAGSEVALFSNENCASPAITACSEGPPPL